MFAWVIHSKMVRDASKLCATVRERALGGAEIRRSQRIERGFRKAASNYFARRFPGRITLVRSSEFASLRRKENHLGWADLAAQGLDSFIIPGPHLSMFDEPSVRYLAEKLRFSLDAVQPDQAQLPQARPELLRNSFRRDR